MNNMVAVYGKSGAGKNYVCEHLMMKRVISRTTRPMRTGEVNGREYHFITVDEMESYPRAKIFNPEVFNGHHYFCLLSDLEGKNAYIVGPEGARYMQKINESNAGLKKIHMMYVKSPVYKRIIRMRKRGDSWKNILKRICQELGEFRSIKHDIIYPN